MEKIKIFEKSLKIEIITLEYVLSHGYDEPGDKDKYMLYSDIYNAKTVVVSAFPGTGKSFVHEKFKNSRILDSDSSKFDKTMFPGNYLEHIKENIGEVDIIFVSSHETVRNALKDAGIKYILVYPEKELKDEYIKRYIERGSPETFIQLIKNNWDQWLDDISNVEGCYHHELYEGRYLSDFVTI